MRNTLYIALVAIGSLAVVLSVLLYLLSSTAVFDTNLDLFLHRLTVQEQAGITGAVHGVMLWQVVLLALTNVAWVVGVAIILRRSRPAV